LSIRPAIDAVFLQRAQVHFTNALLNFGVNCGGFG
jgi:hypothetical protein